MKVHLCSCYAYYATAANLDTLYPPVKNLSSTNLHKHPQYVYTSVAKEFICAHMDFQFADIYTQSTVEEAQYFITGTNYC